MLRAKAGKWFAAVCVLSLLASAVAGAATVRIDSDPQGAAVTLLKGFKRVRLGETPLDAELEFRSESSILRLEFSKPGFETETLQVTGGDASVSATLQAIDALEIGTAPGSATAVLESRLQQVWPAVLEAIHPWQPVRPAGLVDLGGYKFLELPAGSADLHLGTDAADDASRVAARRLVAVLNLAIGDRFDIDGVIIRIEEVSRGGVRTEVGTRLVVETVCQGGMVTRSVWDSCASVSTTTSQTAYGSSVQTKCVGGTVNRNVYDACARRVPKQKRVLDIRSEPGAETKRRTNAIVLEARPDGMHFAGVCRDGKPSPRDETSEVLAALCR
jgi:hypothetical protein